MTLKEIQELIEELENLRTLSKENEDDVVIIDFSERARDYLLNHNWCNSVENGWLGISWGTILCVFFFKISSNFSDVDDYVWMINGDLPSAYIDIESAKNPIDALEGYVEVMSDWVIGVESGKGVDDCYPIGVPPTREYASMLKSRLKLITEEIAEQNK